MWGMTTIAIGTFLRSRRRAIRLRSKTSGNPEIVYDVHQMGTNTARIFVPPWMDPGGSEHRSDFGEYLQYDWHGNGRGSRGGRESPGSR